MISRYFWRRRSWCARAAASGFPSIEHPPLQPRSGWLDPRRPNAGVFFYHWTERYEDKGNTKLADFEQAAWDAIGAHPRVSFKLLSDLLPPGSDDSLGWHGANGADHVHPNAFGHSYRARELILDACR
jgi:hypothetical protein